MWTSGEVLENLMVLKYTILVESSLPLILPLHILGPSFLIVVLKTPIFAWVTAIRRCHWSILVTSIATLLGSVAFFLSSTLAYAGV